ncbi:MAG: hypothetical protein JWM88_2659 [Verrucomicrobia bacterium]|nr:hypothetical protein [Verrucomicrobiota bacterium]
MSLVDLLVGAAAVAVLLAPGWMLARAARIPYAPLAGFIASVAGLVMVVLLLDALAVPLTLASCGAVWLLLTAAIGWFGRKTIFRGAALPASAPFAWREHWPLFLALIPAGMVVLYRATAQPLFGIDTVFRWNFLALQMVARGALGFYPPVTAADYEIYAWPDGIAPAVSVIYFWVYTVAHATRPILTAPAVILQYALLLAGAFALARRFFSDRAAAFALAFVACSPVVAWATAMGQESGLVALSLVALLLYLPRERADETLGGAAFAGLAAGLGALAREYGLALILLGLALALARRLSWRSLVCFAAAAALAAFPWYLRNWIHTGNPLFNLGLGGWFPINRTHAWLIQSYQEEFGWTRVSAAALRFLFVNCAVVLAAGLAGAAVAFRRARSLLVAAALIVALWAASLGYTAAGFTTAIRVLSPALVILAVLGGAAGARWIPGERRLGVVGLGLMLVATDAALRALTLPGTVYQIPRADWLAAGNAVHEYHSRPVYREIARFAGAERILVLGPNALLTLNGARTVPPWSPEVAFLFDDRLPAAEVARRLRAANIGFMLLNQGPANERFLAHSAYFREPGGTLKAMRFDDQILLKVVSP